jgi:hypothetical protein
VTVGAYNGPDGNRPWRIWAGRDSNPKEQKYEGFRPRYR